MNYVCFSGLALSDPEAQTENCFMFIGTRWMWSNIRHVFQSVIIFCRFHSNMIFRYSQYLEQTHHCAFSKYCELENTIV